MRRARRSRALSSRGAGYLPHQLGPNRPAQPDRYQGIGQALNSIGAGMLIMAPPATASARSDVRASSLSTLAVVFDLAPRCALSSRTAHHGDFFPKSVTTAMSESSSVFHTPVSPPTIDSVVAPGICWNVAYPNTSVGTRRPAWLTWNHTGAVRASADQRHRFDCF
jgi:hypothetical protein